MQGIYCFTNLLNNKKYIGQSVHIEQRHDDHLRYYKDDFRLEGCPKFYSALRKYGEDNFSFEVLEEVKNQEDLTDREEFWINYYNSINNGYNCVHAKDSYRGESNPQNVLSLEQVKEVRNKLETTKLTPQEIADQYGVHYTTIYRINRGEIWFDSDIDYPIRK